MKKLRSFRFGHLIRVENLIENINQTIRFVNASMGPCSFRYSVYKWDFIEFNNMFIQLIRIDFNVLRLQYIYSRVSD